MKCPYCDTEFEMETLADYDSVLQNEQPDSFQWDSTPSENWTVDEASGLHTYSCQSCGGEIIGDETLAATACPYCGNPVVMMGQFTGSLKPDLVIPFKLDKKAAVAALQQHYRGKRFLPKVFKDENHIQEVKGLYVPFWLFDARADADIRYRATRVRSWSDRDYDYTETSYYALMRSGSLSFAGVPADGSSKMADDLMESIEPFDLSQAVDFQTAYLAGYLADKFDVSAEQSAENANSRIRQSTTDAFAATVQGYSSVIPESSSIRLNSSRVRYGLLPVWLLNTVWKGETYTFAMNGQTGKLVGNLPLDKSAFTRWFFGLTGLFTAIGFGLSYLLWR